MASCAHAVRADQFLKSLIAVCEPQDEVDGFTDGTLKALLRTPYVLFLILTSWRHDLPFFFSNLPLELASASTWMGSEKVLSPLVKGLCNQCVYFVSPRLPS